MTTLDPISTETTLLLSHQERLRQSVHFTLSMAAAGLLLISALIRLRAPDQASVADLVAGAAALLVAFPALSGALHSLRHPDLHGVTDLLIGLALLAAWATGDLVTATLLPLVMMMGHVLEERSLLGSQEAINALMKLTHCTARKLDEHGHMQELPAAELCVGDLIEVRPGDRIPADGRVESGESSVDNASLTGESIPVDVMIGDPVYASAINVDGQLRIRVTDVGENATLGRVISLMQEAEHAKPPLTRLLERYAGRYLILVLVLAAGTWVVTQQATAMLAVLVAACPCAVVLAAPATAIAAVAAASRHGILIKGTAFLEQLSTVDSVIWDKTGTLTVGHLQLVKAVAAEHVDETELLTLAGSLGHASSHPVSRALAAQLAADARLPVDQIRENRGLGVIGYHKGHRLAMGRPALFTELEVATTVIPAHQGPLAGLARDGQFLGWFLLADQPRAESRQALAELHSLGLTNHTLLTGDRAPEADRIAKEIGIDQVVAEALSAQKMQHVLQAVSAGRRPLVIGDGINDALALKSGAVGLAMGAQGSDVALASADLVLVTNDLRRVATCLRLSRRCRRTIYINVVIGMGWTFAIMGLAAFGGLGAHAPLIAAVLHNLGTLGVMINAGRLLKFSEP